jgi:CheY-like chemotaxis protein
MGFLGRIPDMQKKSYLEGKRILVVDDEEDVLGTIEEALEESHVETARDYQSALDKIKNHKYDLAVLDIMGVDGLKLLEKAVDRGIPSVMLTAHALSPETLMDAVRKGAISYLPKEKLAEIDQILNDLLAAHDEGRPTWKVLFDQLGDFFEKKFGPDWKEKDKKFWSEFSRTYQISKGIQRRISHDEKVRSKGV